MAVKKSRLEYIIPTLLALVITIGLIRFIPVLSEKHQMRVMKTETVPLDDYRFYYDLNGDGTSEIIYIYYNTSGNLAISIASLHFATINQFNLPGQLLSLGNTLDFHDIDSDGIMDIFICTEKNDSLFLTIIDDLYGHPTTTSEYFIERINAYNDNGDYLFSPGTITDLTRDGFQEYVFGINGGHSLQPRCVYAIDYRNDSVFRSPLSGAAVVGLGFFDLDKDGADEILLNTVAPENFKFPFPYRDSISWLIVLDESLQFYKPPIEMNKPPSWLSMEPFIYSGNNYLMVYHRFRESLGDFSAMLTIYNDSLRPVNTRYFHGHKNSRNHIWKVPGSLELSDIRMINDFRIYTLDFDLQYSDSIINETAFGNGTEILLDVDKDGEQEYVMLGGNKLVVFRSDLTESASVDILQDTRAPRVLISMIEEGDTYPTLFAQIGSDKYFIRYAKNKWFHYRGLVYPGIFIVLFALFYLWGIIQNRLIATRYEKDRLISNLQLQSIKNQLDPHFTYNALNAVGSLIYKEEKDLAYQYLKGLTDLLRMVSGDASEVTWTLSDELEFVHKYLEIEKLRFREKFNYSVEVDEDQLKTRQVPKMSILTFVENSIKHGLKHKQDDWNLEIKVSRQEKGFVIGIKDNGIGRAASAKYREESTGNGIKMMEKYFKLFNEATGHKARFKITDLFEYDLRASGTLVEITIR